MRGASPWSSRHSRCAVWSPPTAITLAFHLPKWRRNTESTPGRGGSQGEMAARTGAGRGSENNWVARAGWPASAGAQAHKGAGSGMGGPGAWCIIACGWHASAGSPWARGTGLHRSVPAHVGGQLGCCMGTCCCFQVHSPESGQCTATASSTSPDQDSVMLSPKNTRPKPCRDRGAAEAPRWQQPCSLCAPASRGQAGPPIPSIAHLLGRIRLLNLTHMLRMAGHPGRVCTQEPGAVQGRLGRAGGRSPACWPGAFS